MNSLHKIISALSLTITIGTSAYLSAQPTYSGANPFSASVEATFKDIPYAATSTAQKMDIYMPTGAGPFPAVVLIHGGAFKVGDKAMENATAAKLVANGYIAIAINYRLSGEATFPAAVHDAKAAVRFIRANSAIYKVDPNKIAAWGASAGGYLSAMLGTSGGDPYLEGVEGSHLTISSTIQACIDWFGPINFAEMTLEAKTLGFPEDYTVNNESKFLGVDATNPANKTVVQIANPTSYIDKSDPPFWIQVGSADPLIPYTQSTHFFLALKNVIGHDKASYELLQGAKHGGSLFKTEENMTKAITFLNSKLQ